MTGRRTPRRAAASLPEDEPPELIEGTAPQSELANAERLIAAHGSDLRHCPGIGWLAWDGRRWARDEARVAELAKATLRELMERTKAEEEAIARRVRWLSSRGRPTKAEEARLEALAKLVGFVARSQSARGIAGMLALAATDPRVHIDVSALDADPYLLTAANGTIDLRTSTLLPHIREHLITCASPVAYDPAADTADWVAFVERAMMGDAESVSYLQAVFGYSCTGLAHEEQFWFFAGLPGSGKGTIVDAVLAALGDSGKTCSFDSFCYRMSPAEQRPDLAALRGARVVVASEVSSRRELDEATLSTVTGGDRVNACAKYQDPISFDWRASLFLCANKKPRVNPNRDETGIHRRMRIVPFDLRVEEHEKDSGIKLRFRSPSLGGPAVLRWIVDGARSYLAAGKLPALPARMGQAAEEYRRDNDPIADFVSGYLVLADVQGDPQTWIPRSRLRELYEAFCRESGITHPMQAKDLNKALRGPPYNLCQGRGGVGVAHAWRGARERRSGDAEQGENDGRSMEQRLADEAEAERKRCG